MVYLISVLDPFGTIILKEGHFEHMYTAQSKWKYIRITELLITDSNFGTGFAILMLGCVRRLY